MDEVRARRPGARASAPLSIGTGGRYPCRERPNVLLDSPVLRLAILALLVGLAGTTTLGSARGSRVPVGKLLGPVPVVEVIDGDTIVLASDLGPRTVRLIGIDAPEASRPERGPEPSWEEATTFAEELLPQGTPVWVELDLEVEDAYGRLLGYVYVADPSGDWNVGDATARMVNLAIAEAGYARALPIRPNLVYADLFRGAVQAARDGGLGIWGAGAAFPAADAEQGPSPAADLPPGPIVLACALYDPDVPNELDAETVTLLLREPLDTRGYYLHDRGSGTILPLPPGEHGPGELVIRNPGQGIWNNGGDTIYLERAGEVIDAWNYTEARPERGGTVCRRAS